MVVQSSRQSTAPKEFGLQSQHCMLVTSYVNGAFQLHTNNPPLQVVACKQTDVAEGLCLSLRLRLVFVASLLDVYRSIIETLQSWSV